MKNEELANRSFSSEELHELWLFTNAQYQILKEKHDKSQNHVESVCLAFAANCIIDIMDEIAEMLEPTNTKKSMPPPPQPPPNRMLREGKEPPKPKVK
jgi:hypothetical protein